MTSSRVDGAGATLNGGDGSDLAYEISVGGTFNSGNGKQQACGLASTGAGDRTEVPGIDGRDGVSVDRSWNGRDGNDLVQMAIGSGWNVQRRRRTRYGARRHLRWCDTYATFDGGPGDDLATDVAAGGIYDGGARHPTPLTTTRQAQPGPDIELVGSSAKLTKPDGTQEGPPRRVFPPPCDAEGGNRTPTPFQAPDFESGASTSSATSARPKILAARPRRAQARQLGERERAVGARRDEEVLPPRRAEDAVEALPLGPRLERQRRPVGSTPSIACGRGGSRRSSG